MPVNPDHDVPTRSSFARLHPGARTASRHAPIKKPRFRGVVKQLAQPLGAEAELPFTEHDGGLSKRKAPGSRSGLRALCAIQVFSAITVCYSHFLTERKRRRISVRKNICSCANRCANCRPTSRLFAFTPGAGLRFLAEITKTSGRRSWLRAQFRFYISTITASPRPGQGQNSY